ncbi:MAG: tetratricopeptide repeat protein [Arcobacteraceae bacterium]|jgi:TolA-binding protein
MKRTLSFLLLSTIAISEEISVFGAGNLDSNKPYGLSTTEKHILKNKSELNSIDTKVKDVKDTIESVSQRIDGLESIYEGDSRKINDAVLKINDLVKKEELYNSEIEKIKAVTAQILQIQEENNTNNNKNLETLKLAIATLDKSINSINNSLDQFVRKDELEKNKKVAQKEDTSKAADKLSDEDAKLSKEELLVKAKELFEKKLFNQAIPIFEDLIAKNFKPAESNFYLGEIWYARKQYNDAIGAFKKSALLYDKASYMPKLLLHSAISFENIKDKENAKSFYSTVIEAYPNSAEAPTAKKNLSKLK